MCWLFARKNSHLFESQVFVLFFFVSITFPQMSCEQNAPTGPDDSNDEFQIENSGEKSNVDMKTSNKEVSRTSKTDFGFSSLSFIAGFQQNCYKLIFCRGIFFINSDTSQY